MPITGLSLSLHLVLGGVGDIAEGVRRSALSAMNDSLFLWLVPETPRLMQLG